MSGAEIVELVCLILAFACVCFLVESRIELADEKIAKALAQARADTYLKRALDSDVEIRRMNGELAQRLVPVHGRTGFDRHADQALDVQS